MSRWRSCGNQTSHRWKANHPNHVHDMFFLHKQDLGTIARTLDAGDFVINPWDHKFEDNFGFYRLHILMERGNGQIPDRGPID